MNTMNKSHGYIPWFSPELGENEKRSLNAVIDSNYINDGKVARLFENKLAHILGVKHCVAVTNGTAAIALSLMGLGVGYGDEVIVPDLTFIATANAVRLTGASVKLIDIEPMRFTLNIERVKSAIGSHTKAIIPVDVNGRGADYISLEKIAKDSKLFIVCDSTEALGSKFQGRYLGTFGDAGCFSFSANKTITTGQGGAVVTDNTNLYYRLLELKDQGRRNQGTGGDDLHPVMGYNFKYTDLQAAIGLAQLERLPERLAKSKERDLWYQEFFRDCPAVTLPSLNNLKDEISQWTDILVEDKVVIASILDKHKIGCRSFWHPIHTQIPYLSDGSSFTNSSNISKKGLWLPSYFGLTKEEAGYTAKIILEALCQN